MRIYLSRKGTRKPHVVLECTLEESARIYTLAVEKVGKPAYETVNGKARYRFPGSKLVELTDTFPQAEQSPAVAASIHAEPDLEVPEFKVPGFAGELDDNQKLGVWLASRRKKFLILDDMRVGKTLQALCAVVLKARWPVLVVCPNNVKDVWAKHIEQYFPDLSYVVVGGNPRERTEQLATRADITIAHYEAIRIHTRLIAVNRRPVAKGEFVDREWGAIILDELHHIKSPEAKQTQMVHQLNAPVKILLSGTPILNGRLEELWGPLHFAWPKKFRTYWSFTVKYCIVKRGQIVGYKNVEELRRFMLANSIRRLNPSQLEHRVLNVDLTEEQRRLYEEIRDEMVLWMEDGKKKSIRDIMVRSARLKEACFSPELYGGSPTSSKIIALKSLVAKLLKEPGNKVIVFSQWARATRIIRRELGTYAKSVAYVDGDVKLKLRDAERERFQVDPDCRIFIGTIRANFEGIALHAATHVVFTDLEWVPAWNDQATRRALTREPKPIPVQVIEIRARDSIEEHVLEVLNRKRLMNAQFIERDGGRKVKAQIAAKIKEIL